MWFGLVGCLSVGCFDWIGCLGVYGCLLFCIRFVDLGLLVVVTLFVLDLLRIV